MRKREAGFTVLEVLVVGGIIGIIAAIAIVSYTNAINRARQKRTVNDIRVIAQAWEARASDTQTYQIAGYTFPAGDAIPHDTLVSALRPTYLRDIPSVDGWRRPLQFAVQPGTGGSPGEYAIRSPGRDGLFDARYAESGPTTDPDCDIVWANGSFVSYPDVVQGQ
jgi:type II secretory pathway pseudopilin PulG